MQEGRASRTAEGAAAARAMHTLLDADPVLSDPYAVRLTSSAWRRATTIPIMNRLVKNLLMRRMRPIAGQVVVRSRYAEEKLEEAVAAGVSQYVIIGAGFDSFTYRRRDLEDRLQVFELDHPDTQRLKLERLEALDEPAPLNVEYVAVDFEQETVATALSRSEYDGNAPAFFSWLGTTPYLTREATFSTLAAIASAAASGSEIVFDYLIPDVMVPESERAVMKKLYQFADTRGEPLIGHIEPQLLWKLLDDIGFEKIEDLDYTQQTRRYFAERRDGLRPLAAANLACAKLI